MPDFTLKRLTRGVKLLTGHLHTQVASALAQLTSTGVDYDNLEDGYGTFRVNLSIPWFAGRDGPTQGKGNFRVPFTLPPFQEFFSTAGTTTAATPNLVLQEVGISFDQRAEGAAISTFYDLGAGSFHSEGQLYFSKVTEYDLKISILEKEMSAWGSTVTSAQKARFTAEFSAEEAFEGKNLRFNPTVLSDLDIVLNPYRTYIMELDCQPMTAVEEPGIAFNNILVSLRFRQRLVDRDTGAANVQNIPSHNGVLNTSAVTISTPAADAVIEADHASTGVNTIFEKADGVFLAKMNAGYDSKSRRRTAERIAENAGYEVIAVPMWGNQETQINGQTYADLPSPTPETAHHTDRRIIPLIYPMTIHHVILAYNLSPFKAGSSGSIDPTVATFTNTVGVGVGSGIRADGPNYGQVAYAQWTPSTISNYQIDRVEQSNQYIDPPTTSDSFYLLNCPLTYVSGNAGTNYGSVSGALADGGKPFFAGQTNSGLGTRSARSQTLNGSTASNFGREQFLEVRWDIYDSGGFNASAWTSPSVQTILGSGGHWVYIIGKKHLV